MRSARGVGVLIAVLAFALAVPATASAVRLAAVASGFASPVHVAAPRSAPSGTLWIVEQGGRIWKWRAGSRTLFLDIRGRVSSGGERGLLSIAFDPGWRQNRLFYVFFTDNGGDLRIVRYRASSNGSRALPTTNKRLLKVEHSAQGNHNGGQLAFGPNGRLYASTGDGGGRCDPNGNAQRLRSRLGKLLSLNPRNVSAGWRVDGYGLRNLWRFSFDRATGRFYGADVGQNAWEEVNTRAADRLGELTNYGWDAREGKHASGCRNNGLNSAGLVVGPIAEYNHSAGCSVTGGFAYRGRALSSLRGWYVFGDYCTGTVWRLLVRSNGRLAERRRLLLNTSLNISSFGEAPGGELFVADHGGTIYKLVRS